MLILCVSVTSYFYRADMPCQELIVDITFFNSMCNHLQLFYVMSRIFSVLTTISTMTFISYMRFVITSFMIVLHSIIEQLTSF